MEIDVFYDSKFDKRIIQSNSDKNIKFFRVNESKSKESLEKFFEGDVYLDSGCQIYIYDNKALEKI